MRRDPNIRAFRLLPLVSTIGFEGAGKADVGRYIEQRRPRLPNHLDVLAHAQARSFGIGLFHATPGLRDQLGRERGQCLRVLIAEVV